VVAVQVVKTLAALVNVDMVAEAGMGLILGPLGVPAGFVVMILGDDSEERERMEQLEQS
jgi:hypothetical protein